MARARKTGTGGDGASAPPEGRKARSKSLDDIAQKLLEKPAAEIVTPPAPLAPAPAAKKTKAAKRPADAPVAAPAAKKKAAKKKAAPKTAKAAKPAASDGKPTPTRPPLGHAEGRLKGKSEDESGEGDHITVRRMHRRDINRVWDFLKLSFRDVNRETVEYQRPRSKQRFEESYDDEGIEQLLFEVDGEIVGYAECAFEVTGSDNWINPKYFETRDMRPLFVEELATHPDYQGRGVGSFMLEQLQHLARIHGCTHLVLEVAENNEDALTFYKRRAFYKLDAALFMAMKVDREPDLLPPRALKTRPPVAESDER